MYFVGNLLIMVSPGADPTTFEFTATMQARAFFKQEKNIFD
jgi:hypothetical protein